MAALQEKKNERRYAKLLAFFRQYRKKKKKIKTKARLKMRTFRPKIEKLFLIPR